MGFFSAVHSRALADNVTTSASAKNWSRPIYYDPPNQTRLKFRLTGNDATQLPNSGGSVQITGAQIKQYGLAGGAPEMTAATPDCIYSARDETLSSSNTLTVHAQNDRLFLEGTGFVLFQTNSTLLVSNATHSILRNPGTNGQTLVTEIVATSAEFRMKTENANGLALYRENVRVTDPRMQLQSELLTVDLPRAGSADRHIVAETNVALNFISESGQRLAANSGRAVYNYTVENGVTNEVLELTGSPRVNLSNGWMTAELITLDRTTGKVTGETNFHFHYLSEPTATNSTNAPMPTDIYADHFVHDLNTRAADFRGRVQVTNAQMRLASEWLTTTLPATGTTNAAMLENILAETNVVIDFIDQASGRTTRALSQKASYEQRVTHGITNSLLTLTGNPALETFNPQGWMTADLIKVDRSQGTIVGVGNQHSVLKKSAGETASQDIEVFSDRFDFAEATGLATYNGNVRAYDPEINLTSKTLTLKFVQGAKGQSNRLDQAVADGKVALDFMDKPFFKGDITNLNAFAERLRSPKPDDGIGNYFGAQLLPPTRALLNAYTNSLDPKNVPLQLALIGELNRWVTGGLLYEPVRFTNVFLSLQTQAALRSSMPGMQLMVANRLLLLDAFRGQLARNKNGEPTHGIGNQAIYTYKAPVIPSTNAYAGGVLELRGHPRLDHGDSWATANQAIIDDRATGELRGVGQPKFHTLVESVAPNKTGGGQNGSLKKSAKSP